MAEYTVSPADLHAVADHLARQATVLETASNETADAIRDVTLTSTDALALAELQLNAQFDALFEAAAASQQIAKTILWTGPDSEAFQAANLELVQRIDAAIVAMHDEYFAYRDKCRRALVDLDTLQQGFAAACTAHEGETALVRTALEFEAEHYTLAFNGSFGA